LFEIVKQPLNDQKGARETKKMKEMKCSKLTVNLFLGFCKLQPYFRQLLPHAALPRIVDGRVRMAHQHTARLQD
jgi:hypothetical protein